VEPRELTLREVRASPWLQQRELAARLSGPTGLAESTLIRLFRRMEAEGELRSGLDGRRKTYALPEPTRTPTRPPAPAPPAAQPTEGGLWSGRLAPLGEPAPEEPEPDEPESGRGEPVATKPAWPMGVVVAVVLGLSVLAAVVLSPEKHDPLTGADNDEDSKPLKASAPPPPRPKPRRAASAAKNVRVAVLNGVSEAGVAAKEAKRLKAKGFRIGAVAKAPHPAERSAVLYARGERAAARALAEEAGIDSVGAADSEIAGASRGAKLAVVVGAGR